MPLILGGSDWSQYLIASDLSTGTGHDWTDGVEDQSQNYEPRESKDISSRLGYLGFNLQANNIDNPVWDLLLHHDLIVSVHYPLLSLIIQKKKGK